MKSERWNEVKRLFHEALELPPEEIEGFLDRSCGDDTELRRELEDLIRADEPARQFMECPILGERSAILGPMSASAEPSGVLARFLRQFEEVEQAEGLKTSYENRFAPGTVLDQRYRIVYLLGRGGMGEVYRADDLKLEQAVALKFLPELAEGDEAKRARLLEEVKIARQVTHPNVCRVYDVGEMDSHLFLSMELIEGEDLSSLLRRVGRPTPEKALELARQLAEGLAAAHEQGVLHCDLKPANLMIDGEGRLRITDFGIARAAGSPSSATAHGTPAYMAPEQIVSREASPASDVYALGLVMYELFTGRRPFKAEALAELVRLHREKPPSPPSNEVEDIEPALEKLILSCLEKNPTDRPASASEVAQALSSGEDAVSESMPRKTLLISHLVRSEQEELGDTQIRYFASLHRRILRKLLREHRGHEVEKTDDTLQLLFDRPIQAVRHALAYQRALDNFSEGEGGGLTARIGIHLCGISPAEDLKEMNEEAPQPKVMDLDTAERLSSLAAERQILMTREAFDLARQSAASGFHGVRWLAHGSYEMTELVESLGVYEVGEKGVAPLRVPKDSSRGRRRMVQETISGWRPAPGQGLPNQVGWIVERKLSEGGFGEVWLVVDRETRERRVFKFCYDSARLRSLQREITLFRLLKETLGDREDITRVLDWNFDEAPYFIESEYTAGGSLLEWAESEGGLEKISMATRLDIVAQVATALAAAHSVGVLHKDVKPGNVLVTTDVDGRVRVQLSDFGVGLVTERQRLVDAGITVLGMTEAHSHEFSSGGGTQLYMAPELLEGKPATVQADTYALGVMLYQMVVEDFSRALAPGWDRDVTDEHLWQDIAIAVDGSPEQRLSSVGHLGERLRTLEVRRKKRATKRREEIKARKLEASLTTVRRRRKIMALVIGILALFSTVVTILLYDVKQQAQRANREAETASQVSDFLIGLFETSTPFRYRRLANKITAREILDRGAEKIERELKSEPLVRSRMMQAMGVIYQELGAYEKSKGLIEGALKIRRGINGVDDLEVVESLNASTETMWGMANFEKAEYLSREALKIRQKLQTDESPSVAKCLELLAQTLYYKGDLAGAEAIYREAWKQRKERLKESVLTSPESLHGLAVVLLRKGNRNEAEVIYRELLNDQTSILGPNHQEVARTMNSLAILLVSKEKWSEAEELYKKTITIRKGILSSTHPDTALAISNLADLHLKKGSYLKAEKFMKESLTAYQQSLGRDHPHVAFVEHELSKLYRKTGDHQNGVLHLENALEIYRRTLGEEHPTFIYAADDLARLFKSPN